MSAVFLVCEVQLLMSGYKNLILRALEPETVARLCLRPVTFKVGHEIEYPGRPIAHVFFVEEGMASMTTSFHDGTQVEVGMFGYEGLIGISALMGTKLSLNRIYTQIAGSGFSVPVRLAMQEFQRGGVFQSLALRYVQAQLMQATQSAGCNAKHSVHQRLARWLLICADRAHSNSFRMSHEFLADMLGVGRPSVSLAAEGFKLERLIAYNRGLIEILNARGLEQRACECYSVVKDHLSNLVEYDSGLMQQATDGRLTVLSR